MPKNGWKGNLVNTPEWETVWDITNLSSDDNTKDTVPFVVRNEELEFMYDTNDDAD